MYIPTIFLGSRESCVSIDISGSILPSGVSLGQVASGSESYFYIRVDAGAQVYFDVATGVTSQAKLLLIGGGGGTTVYQSNPLNPQDTNTGGGAAGQVIQKDISLQPGRYFMSSSVNITSGSGGESVFRTADSLDPVNWYIEKALGGGDNDFQDGGDGISYSGGTGLSGTNGAGGGGAGSTGNGKDSILVTNYSIGGSGGSGSIIPEPFNSIVGDSVVAGGGGGDSYTGYGGTSVAPNALGSGASRSGTSTDNTGQPGASFLFIPQTGCLYSGSGVTIPDETFYAEGGTIGTFDSGSVKYKYHIYNTPTNVSQFFKVRRGFTNQAKIMQIAGGGGSVVEGISVYVATLEQYLFYPAGYGGGAGAGGFKITENVSLAGLNNLITIGDGGAAFRDGSDTSIDAADTNFVNVVTFGGGVGASVSPDSGSQTGGSGGGGFEPNTAGAAGTSGQGYAGGNGRTGVGATYGGGGGGGGATSIGSGSANNYSSGIGGDGYTLSGFWGFLTGSLFTVSNTIGEGGNSGTGTGYPGYIPTASLKTTQNYDGSGANPVANGGGNGGFLTIVYPISGSTSNSPA